MIVYANQHSILKEIKEIPFELEKEIQKLFEKNLKTISGFTLVGSEFSIKDRRIDILAFDERSKAFIIIECKLKKNSSVVDQGFTYLNLMLENKAEFIVEYNEKLGQKLKREDVDWSQTRVIFVSTDFTDNQIQATNFKDIAIELWQVKKYENNLILLNPIKKSKSAKSIKPIIENDNALKTISVEIKGYGEDDHLQNVQEKIIELYEKFRDSILNLTDNIEISPQKHYIAFKKGGNICDIEVRQKALKISVNAKKGNLNDPKNLARDVSNIGHFGNGDYEVRVDNDDNLEYIMSLVKQIL
jgi:predicted transport protein